MIVVIFCISASFIGSIINDMIDLVLNKEQQNQSISKCIACHHPLKWYDKIPIFTYLLAKGKCRYCKKRISLRYPLVEAISIINFVCVYYLYGEKIQSLSIYILFSLLLILSVIEIIMSQVPLKLLLLIIMLGILSVFTNQDIILLDRVCAIFLVSVPLWMINKVKKGSIGEATIIFCACSGFLLGMWGILFTTCIAYLFFGFYSTVMLFVDKRYKRSKIPMFPFFYIAIVIFFTYAIHLVQITIR